MDLELLISTGVVAVYGAAVSRFGSGCTRDLWHFALLRVICAGFVYADSPSMSHLCLGKCLQSVPYLCLLELHVRTVQ